MRRLRGVLLAVGLTSVMLVAPTTGWGNGPSDDPDPGPKAMPWVEPESAPLAKDNPGEPAKAEFPEAASWVLTLGGRGDPGPVSVSPGVDGVSGRKLKVQVFDRELSEKVGASGFVFRVSEADDGVLTRASLPAKITVNYAGFARAYGADYHQRLRIRVLDDCVLRDPRPRGCGITGPELPVENDIENHKLTVEVEDLTTVVKQGAVFAVTSAAGGPTGTFAATPMSIAGEWQVAPGSGEFTYGYPITVPKPASGTAPTVGLSYSSGAIDGMTHAANTQASETGLGWSTFANAFIERGYEPCVTTLGSPDLCWAGENATISLGGVSGAMVPVNGSFTQWQLLSDPGWKIERDNLAHTAQGKETQFKERWKVTGPDGTTYYFGFGHGPGTFTNSVLGIDVFADHPGDRCRGMNASPGHCRLEWRWYLDRVEDPDGMVTTYVYEKETNYYSARNGAFAPFNSFYDRSAYLTQILYGGHISVWNHQEYSARVVFGTKFRCTYFNTQECPPPPQSQANLLYPDVPLDLVCTEPLGNCGVHSPSFFSSKHYTQVLTQVKKGGTEPEGPVDAFWVTVAATNLSKDWAWTPGTTWPAKLRLDSIQHVGIAHGGYAVYPDLRLEYGYLPNRADVADPNSELAMRNLRLTRITNQFGGVTQINYGQKLPCAADYNPERWDQNARDCFPQTVVDNGHRRTGVFNKYLVAQVREQPGAGSPEMWTGYIYEGAPAWGFDDSSFARFDYLHGWSNWRGYGEAMVTKGTEQQIMSFDGESKTRIRVYRGMNGDRQLIPNPAGPGFILDTNLRQVGVQNFDGVTFPDDRAPGGRTIQEQRLGTLGSTQNTPVTSTSYEYVSRKTHEEAGDLRDAFWVGVWKVTERNYSSTTVYKQRRSVTTYTPTPPVSVGTPPPPPPQPAKTVEEGFTDVTGDERCSITSYADNPTKWMWVYPARNEVAVGNTCASGDPRVSVNETYYDGDASTTPGSTPTRGNPTRQRSLVEGTRWTQSRTEFDVLGRITKVTDPNGRVTTTDYKVDLEDGVADEIEDSGTDGSPFVAIPAKVTVTNPLGHRTVTYLNPEETSLKAEFDANGNRTSYTYDAFGNLISVRLPTEHGAGDEPSWQFSYDVINRVVRTRQLTSTVAQGNDAVFEDSSTIFDGFWRERQTQTQSPASGKVVVSETTYDERGLTRDETASEAFTGTPGTFVDVGSGWDNRTRHIYDKLGREIEDQWWRGLTPVTPSTTTSYGANTVTVTGPTGQVARETVDGLGRTVEVAEKNGATWATSTMTYDLADRLLTVTDPEGNRATYSYYLTGWLLARTDPDRAGALHFYDDAGNNTSTLTTGNNWVYTRYDALNRPLDRRKDSATGPLLASWTYDTASGGKGRLRTETTGNWVRAVTGYDARGRANGTTLTVPTGIPGLSGSYTTSQTYDRADRIKTVSYPAIGGLAAETVTTNYSNQGLPISMVGADQYVRGVTYDDRGRAATAAIGPENWMKKTFAFDADQRPASAETSIAGQTVAKHTLAYNLDGNVKTRTTLLNGSQWTECYGYDPRGRLTDAYTVPTVNMCGLPTERGTGPQPYNHIYAYSPAGRMTQRTENRIVTNYVYPASGQPRPHAPTQVGADTYQWDDRGNLKSRTIGGVAETFAWDVEGRLTSVTSPTNTTSFVYDPSGQRLLRKTNAGATLYFAGHEVTANPSGSSVTAVRSYTFGGQVIATRKTGQPADYIVSDPSGSLELAVPSGATAATASRKYNPYGKVRSETGDMATEQGFVGQIEDASTSLSYLNARYYDTRTAVFVSPDPVIEPKSPKSLNAYTYAANNPMSFSDASGMSPSYIYGIETENIALRAHNKELLDHIGRLNGQLQELQGIILEQQRQINELLTHIDALTAIIYEQQSLIEKLVARVQYLERVVRAQQAQIRSLQAKIKYYEGVITQLVVHAFKPPYVLPLLADIFAGKGITSWEGSKVTALEIAMSQMLTPSGMAPRPVYPNTVHAREIEGRPSPAYPNTVHAREIEGRPARPTPTPESDSGSSHTGEFWEDPAWNILNLFNPFSLPPGLNEDFMCENFGSLCPEVVV